MNITNPFDIKKKKKPFIPKKTVKGKTSSQTKNFLNEMKNIKKKNAKEKIGEIEIFEGAANIKTEEIKEINEDIEKIEIIEKNKPLQDEIKENSLKKQEIEKIKIIEENLKNKSNSKDKIKPEEIKNTVFYTKYYFYFTF